MTTFYESKHTLSIIPKVKYLLATIIYSLAILLSNVSIAQYKIDTIYFDANKERTTKELANFKNIITYFDSLEQTAEVKYYYNNDLIKSIVNYSDYNKKILDGTYKSFHENGIVKCNAIYKNNKKDGIYQTFYDSGKIRRSEVYKDDILISGNYYTQSGADTSFYPLYVKANFPGGTNEFNKKLLKVLNYPIKAKKKSISGRVLLQFIVSKDGVISNIKIKESVDPMLDQAAIEALQKLGNFTPAYDDGYPVESYFKLPINFTLSD